jgi:hypothetical protein
MSRARRMHDLRLLPLWGLAGCPYVFGAPDLSNVDQATTQDSGEETGTDTDTEVPGFDLPDVISLQGRRFIDFVRFELQVADEDLDLVGGTLELSSTVGDTMTLRIPEDIDIWQADGTSTITLPTSFLDCMEGYDATWTARVTDAAGHQGLPQATDVMVEGLGSYPESPYAHEAGYLTGSAVACVTFNVAVGTPPGETLQALRDDLEGVNFLVPDTANWTIEVAWPSTMDVDLFLFVQDETSPYYSEYAIASAVNYGSSWESLTLELKGDLLYQASSAFWDSYGAMAPFVATVQWRPE